ncbi:hypothetical protein GE09DRAFT_1090520 [Coniochaeta sp. 2T2.1]|nr:hypothetical protein GE09DRAFT_1090520 [Coniochaeta sp. 2T2.1]
MFTTHLSSSLPFLLMPTGLRLYTGQSMPDLDRCITPDLPYPMQWTLTCRLFHSLHIERFTRETQHLEDFPQSPVVWCRG